MSLIASDQAHFAQDDRTMRAELASLGLLFYVAQDAQVNLMDDPV